MKINRKLNLVIPVEQDDKIVSYVHSMPLSREVFEVHFMVLAKTFSAIYNEGLGIAAGPRISAMLIRKVAEDLGVKEEVEQGLMAEMRRLSNMLTLGSNGWEYIPLQEAIDHGLLDPDDASEIENALAYFIVASSMHKRSELKAILDGAAKLWGASTTSLDTTEYRNFLQTSTKAEGSGAKETPSSIPS